MILGRVGVVLAVLGSSGAFVPHIPRHTAFGTARAVRHVSALESSREGLHGSGSRFLSLAELKKDELMPRIIQIAGVYPGLTIEELMGPQSTESPGYGRWAYDFSDPEGPQMGTIALPASEIVHASVDPVVVIASSYALGVAHEEMDDVETIVLIDRAARNFLPTKFYAFAAPDDSVVIRWFDSVPEGYTILGRVQYVTLPVNPNAPPSNTGFMEADE